MTIAGVPLLDLKAQYISIRQEVDEAIQEVVESQQFILGPEVSAMEREIADYCQVKHCIGVTSGSDALIVALMALDIKHGDEVITSPYSFFATAGSIARVGATPVFVDIEPKTFNIDSSKIAKAITPRTKAIMPVHLFGQCAEMDPILDLAKRHRLAVIEDAAQAIGAEYRGRRAGAMGHLGCFSFFPSKNLGAFGDAGAVTTNDDQLAERIRVLRMHGSKVKYHHQFVGGNFRLDALQAAVLRVKLRYLDRWTMDRQRNAADYIRTLNEKGISPRWITPPAVVQQRHIFNQFVIRTQDRAGLIKHLQQASVGTEIYYPLPLHLQQCFAHLGHGVGAFPESERAAESTLALPIYPELTLPQKDYVMRSIVEHFAPADQTGQKKAA